MGEKIRWRSKWHRVSWTAADYTPSPEQLLAHNDTHRMRLVAGGERAGKSFSAAMEMLAALMRKHSLWWIVGPDYEQARAEFFYILNALQHGPAVEGKPSLPAKGQCSLKTLWDATIETKTADDVLKLASKAPDGILLCEAAQCGYDVYLKLRGRVAEKRGWLWMSGTFEGSLGWYADYWQRWQSENPENARSFSIPTWSNLAVYPGGRQDPEILALERTYPPDLFLERFGAVPCSPASLVFREFSFADHVKSLPGLTDDDEPELAVDPGYSGESAYSVLLVVQRGGEVHVLDEVYRHGLVAEEIIQVCQSRPWWYKRKVGSDGQPVNEQRIRSGTIDIAGTQHHADRTQEDIWAKYGVRLRSQYVPEHAGRTRLHTFLRKPGTQTPRVLFHFSLPGGRDGVGRPRGILAEFGLYRWPDVSEVQPESRKPVDRDNHSIKALSYWLIDRFGPVDRSSVDYTPRKRGTQLL